MTCQMVFEVQAKKIIFQIEIAESVENCLLTAFMH